LVLEWLLGASEAMLVSGAGRGKEEKVAKRVSARVLVDDQLTEHLKNAETELIAAVKLFEEPKLSRRVGYFTRLVRSQEVVTGLYREELVRQRGPHNKRRKR
jgi:hypothetical protein